MLKYQGHIFAGDGMSCACCAVVDKKASSDPTGTHALRSRMRAELRLRWQKLRVIAKQIIVEHDLLQINAAGLLPVQTPAINMGGTKTQSFQLWFDHALQQLVLGGDGSVMRPYITEAYLAGVRNAQMQMGKIVMAGAFGHTQDTLFQLAVIELQGIMEVTSQQSVRAVAQGLLNNKKPLDIVREIFDRIDKIGVERTGLLVDQIIVSAYTHAQLDTFEAGGKKLVGLMAEALPPKVATGDADLADARRKGPGSRVSRTGKGPSARTIRRIKKLERELAALGMVNVRTAGDDDVCPICEEIADAGPYTIDAARGLIPAHPRCRCGFIAVKDEQ